VQAQRVPARRLTLAALRISLATFPAIFLISRVHKWRRHFSTAHGVNPPGKHFRPHGLPNRERAPLKFQELARVMNFAVRITRRTRFDRSSPGSQKPGAASRSTNLCSVPQPLKWMSCQITSSAC
jgi:hypothetical protein